MRKIDHIVYTVPDLEEAMNWFEEKLDVRPIFGGYHTTQGTKNALLKIGKKCYLELLAIDEKNKEVFAPRWMGIDLITAPKITRWAVQSSDLEKDSQVLKAYDLKMSKIAGGQRKMTNGKLLTWGLTMPLAEPEIEIIPFLIDWQDSENHPADGLEDYCSLVELNLRHPSPESIQPILDQLKVETKVSKGKLINISIVINSPKGLLTL